MGTDAVKGLQLLVDSFAGTDDPEQRDELLQDIIAHETPQALAFLRLVAENQDEDRYLRCDAICALCRRTGGQEQIEPVLLYLSNPYDAYEYTSACGVIGALRLEAAIEIVMAHFDAPLEEACLDATIEAVQQVGGAAAVNALHAWIDAQSSGGGDIDEARALLVCGALERLRAEGSAEKLSAFAGTLAASPALAPIAAAARDAAEALSRPAEIETSEAEEDDGDEA